MAFKRAIVTAVAPLRILIDGDTVPIPFTPKSLIDPATLAVGDVVHADQSGHRLVVLGRAGGLGLLSGRNLIINGNFRTNQRGYASGASLAIDEYSFDRWKCANTGQTLTFTAAPQGQLVTLSVNTGSIQIVERGNLPAGDYVLSWEGTAEGRVYKSGASIPTATVSPIRIAADGTADYYVHIVAIGATKTVGKVQFEAGNVPTIFSASLLGQELALCQRFYYNPLLDITNASAMIAQGTADSTTNARIIVPLAVPMRATPTLVTSGAFGLYNGTTTTVTSIILSSWSTSAVPVLYVGASGLTANRSYLFKRDNSASAKIAFDSEL